MNTIRNPILPGFNPDPSILRVGDDYYIATSTFEWHPGVQIHHSRDLVHWRLLTHPLQRQSQVDLIGNPISGGVWAPCLSYADGTYYLVYTDVKSWGKYMDSHNYVITAPYIEGPWSEPVYLNSSGFDPSLYHDDDGRKWLLNMVWDHRIGRNRFAGIVLQEYDPETNKLVGPVKRIFEGSPLGFTEGPHLYKRNGWYYLLTAEGGTEYNHAVTMARSRTIEGPYEIDPHNPILTSRGKPELPLQKAGHASLVETQTGEWYMAHLVGRPLRPSENCNLGRETALQRCVWTEEGWLRLAGGGNAPQVEVQAPRLPLHLWEKPPERDDFDGNMLSIHFATLRDPANESWLSLTERSGYLRLRGRESLHSLHRQSLVARRLQAFYCEAETCVEFEPEHYQQMAGLICYYATDDYIYLCISRDEEQGKCLYFLHGDNGQVSEPLSTPIPIEGWSRVYLRVVFQRDTMQFYYSNEGNHWKEIGPAFYAGQLSDEYAGKLRFTGTFLGMACQDLSGTKLPADFDYFTYKEHA